MLQININKRAFKSILEGKKTIEGRLLKGIFTKLTNGEIFTFFNSDNSLTVKVMKINSYNNFRDMLIHENINNVVPYCKTIEDGVSLYKNIYKQKINKYKVLAIHFESS
jgi:ASC-1-like (ASCH) protein